MFESRCPQRPVVSGLLLSCLALALAQTARADDGDLDPTFQGDGKWWSFQLTSNLAAAAGVDSNGRLVIVYSHLVSGDNYDFTLLRVPDEGTASLCGGAVFDLGGTNDDRVLAMAIGPDDKAVLVGRAATGGSPAVVPALARIDLATCLLDSGFSGDGKVTLGLADDAELTAVALQPDGKIVVAGRRTVNPGVNDDFMVVRLLANGDPDTSFSGDGVAPVAFDLGPSTLFDRATAVAVRPDGKIVVGGTIDGPLGNIDFGLARLTATGPLDGTFGTGGKVRLPIDWGGSLDDSLRALVLAPNGRIVLGGDAASEEGTLAVVSVFLPDGLLAAGGTILFTYLPTTEINTVRAVAWQGDRKILVAGAAGPAALFSNTDFAVARILQDPEANFDHTFGQAGTTTIPFDLGGWNADAVAGLALQAGRISLVGIALGDSVLGVGAARLDNAYIFADGFESGTTAVWSSTVP